MKNQNIEIIKLINCEAPMVIFHNTLKNKFLNLNFQIEKNIFKVPEIVISLKIKGQKI